MKVYIRNYIENPMNIEKVEDFKERKEIRK